MIGVAMILLALAAVTIIAQARRIERLTLERDNLLVDDMRRGGGPA